jgi:hypothetical protein
MLLNALDFLLAFHHDSAEHQPADSNGYSDH